MSREGAVGELAQADAADPRRRPGEVALDDVGCEADRLEDLRAAVRGDRRDPHLRHHLQKALRDPLHRACLRIFVAERLEHQVWVDRSRAVADEHGDRVHAARFARLDDDSRLQPCPLSHEMVVGSARREQRRDRHALRAGRAVGEDEDVRSRCERCVRLGADALERRLESCDAVGERPRHVDRVRLEHTRLDPPELFELLVAEDRVVNHELARMLGRFSEQVVLRADARLHAHHYRLADRVDRRVRDLREQLLEVRVEQGLATRQHGERGVVAHGADRLLRVAGERRKQHLHVLLRVPEKQLPFAERLRRRRWRRRAWEVGESHRLLRDPACIRLP